MSALNSVQMAFQISPDMAKLLVLLCTKKYVTTQAIEEIYKTVGDARVSVHRLRKQLHPHAVRIKSQRNLGYWVTPEDRTKIFTEVVKYTTPIQPPPAA